WPVRAGRSIEQPLKDTCHSGSSWEQSLGSDPVSKPSAVRWEHGWMPAQLSEVFNTYWRFAARRHRVYLRRVYQEHPEPWTSDPILANHRFTNAYRAADRVSQYLIRRVIYFGDPKPEETVFRILLYKL